MAWSGESPGLTAAALVLCKLCQHLGDFVVYTVYANKRVLLSEPWSCAANVPGLTRA